VESALGMGSGGRHLVNLGLHLAVALAAGLLAGSLGGSAPWAAGLVLLHPHAAGLVGNVTGRTDLLAALGLALALWLLKEGKPLAGAVALALACLSKETAFVGVILWGVLAWPEQRWRGFLLPAAAGGAVFLLRWVCVGLPPPSQMAGDGGILVGLSSTGWAFFDLLVPVDAGAWPVPHVIWPGWAFLALGVIAARWWRLGVIWIVLSWALVAGWTGLEVRASRSLLYLPALGLALVVGEIMLRKRGWAWAVAASLGAGMALLQFRAMEHWSDPLTLWSHGVERNPTDPLPQVNLARVHAEAGRHQQARVHYTNAASLSMARGDATFFVKDAHSLGELALLDGNQEAARVYFQDAVNVAGPGGALSSEQRLAEFPAPETTAQDDHSDSEPP